MSPLQKTAIRRAKCREQAVVEPKALIDPQSDAYQHYLYGLWHSNNAAVPELRPLSRIPGIEPDGFLSITTEFKERARSLANELLPAVASMEMKR
jgi:hypothetical protein